MSLPSHEVEWREPSPRAKLEPVKASLLKRRGHPDGPPPTRKKPGFDWLYLQMIQQQDARGYFAGKFKVILAKVVE